MQQAGCSFLYRIDVSLFAGLTAYNMSKYGMTMVALGVAAEYEDMNITGNTLWPATVIESQASINFAMGERKHRSRVGCPTAEAAKYPTKLYAVG